jgi:hypothetical protein
MVDDAPEHAVHEALSFDVFHHIPNNGESSLSELLDNRFDLTVTFLTCKLCDDASEQYNGYETETYGFVSAKPK